MMGPPTTHTMRPGVSGGDLHSAGEFGFGRRAYNTGLQRSRGELLVFLDGDDRFVPEGWRWRRRTDNSRPIRRCAFVSGAFRRMDRGGRALGGPRRHDAVRGRRLLGPPSRKNHICMHAAVMFRRRALELRGRVNHTSLPACEDYRSIL